MSLRRVVIYVAASLDGRIANAAGSVDWLMLPNDGKEEDYGYAKFMKRVSTILMGRKTYESVLGFDCEYPYKNLENIIFTQNPAYSGAHAKTEGVKLQIVCGNIVDWVERLREEGPADTLIYANGGGEIFRELLAHNLIDEIILTIHPSIQGGGPPLLPGPIASPKALQLISHQAWPSGLIQLHYKLG